jgi:hypothetical protein
MTIIKIAGKPAASASDAIESYADKLYRDKALRVVAIVEFKHAGINEPAPDEGKDRSVEIRISGLEVASPAQEDDLRKAMRALYLARTAEGTLDPDGEYEASKGVMSLIGERLADAEMVRLMVGVRHWAEETSKVFRTQEATVSELRHELQRITDGLRALAWPGLEDEDKEGK